MNERTHQVTHSGEKTHAFKQCGKSLFKAGHLREHQERTHRGKKPYVGKQCGKSFTQAGNFRVCKNS